MSRRVVSPLFAASVIVSVAAATVLTAPSGAAAAGGGPRSPVGTASSPSASAGPARPAPPQHAHGAGKQLNASTAQLAAQGTAPLGLGGRGKPYRPATSAATSTTARALTSAASTGSPVEVPSLDDATTVTYANPDGTMTAHLSAGPVRVQQNGQWVPVDPTRPWSPPAALSPPRR